jgi:hypothetical protein
MNKQELIDKLKKRLKAPSEIDDADFNKFYNLAINYAIYFAEQLDEPKRPAVPRYVADFYESIKDDFEGGVYELCTQFYEDESQLSDELYWWFKSSENKPIETLVMMHKFGYEVKKEKLYTVKFSNEDFGKIYIGIFKKFNKLGISSLPLNDDEIKSWFTEDELKRFKFWDNPAFEVREVEEE